MLRSWRKVDSSAVFSGKIGSGCLIMIAWLLVSGCMAAGCRWIVVGYLFLFFGYCMNAINWFWLLFAGVWILDAIVTSFLLLVTGQCLLGCSLLVRSCWSGVTNN